MTILKKLKEYNSNYEIEKRSKLSIKEFNKLKLFLDKNAKYLGFKEMKSFLFQKPTFLRIRLIKGSYHVIITEKIGSYNDPARFEKEKKNSFKDLSEFIFKKEE